MYRPIVGNTCRHIISFKNVLSVEQIRRFNTDSSNYLLLFTNKKPECTRNKTNLERLDQNLMFVLLLKVGLATTEPKHRLNDVNYLPSRPSTAASIIL